MSSESRIPLVVSVTGHRLIPEENFAILRDSVRAFLRELKAKYPNTPLKLMTNLAEGADSLCAGIALEEEIPLIAALPQPMEQFRTCFAGEKLEEFNRLISLAECVFTVPDMEQRDGTAGHDFDYRQGGLYLASHSQLLLALWEGNEPKPGGCGTAEVVDFARKRGIPVCRIVSPRTKDHQQAGKRELIGNPEGLRKLDTFNRKAAALKEEMNPGICSPVYHAATRLSLTARDTYHRLLKWISVIGTGLALSLLLYDELSLGGMIFVCGILLASLIGIRLYASKCNCHEEYIDYRVLAESVRVQSCLRYAGSEIQMQDLFTVYQRETTGWITSSVPVLEIGNLPQEKHDIAEVWLKEQRDYHADRGKKNSSRAKKSNVIVSAACALSIVLYLAAVLLELFRVGIRFRLGICIALGFFSAASLFISLYFGRLSVSRHSLDNRMMEKFYDSALEKLRLNGQTEELLEECAREELIENANWHAYTAENAPDISFI